MAERKKTDTTGLRFDLRLTGLKDMPLSAKPIKKSRIDAMIDPGFPVLIHR
jgi:hypothetical protein